jgi:hypothetical protein
VIIKAGDTTLAAGGKEGPIDLTINGTRLVEESEFPRDDEPEFYDRGNRRTVIEFGVWRMFALESLAEVFMIQHDDDVPTVADVTLTAEGAGNGAVRYYRQASVQTVDRKQKGVSVFTRYHIVGGVSSIQPGTNVALP